ncbi:MAG: hypothetical protein HYX59_02910 [Elusimicrobia bacterium]|nr:hypothetical protein [Elusimicrobiota bacterium]
MKIIRSLLALFLAFPAAAQVRVVPALQAPAAPAVSVLAAPALSAPSIAAPLVPSLSPSLLSAPAAPQAPVAVVPAALPARTVLGLRDDADRLYAALAEIHSKEKANETPAALNALKRALLLDFDGVIAGLPAVTLPEGLSPRGQVKVLRRERAKAERAGEPLRLAAVSGELAALQLRVAREMISEESPLAPKSFKRNAALWSLVGAHNSAAASAAEATRLEALARGEEVFGDGRPYVVWNRWSNIHSELEAAARHARNGRPAEARKVLRAAAATLRLAGRDAADLKAADAFEALAKRPGSDAILAAKSLVPHPEVKTAAPVPYERLSSAMRAQVHALESTRADYLETLDFETSLRHAEALLSSPRPSAADRAQARARLSAAAEWAGRGRVEAKRLAARNLESAVGALDRGDLKLAALHATWTVATLSERRAELSRIALSVRRRLLSALA